MMKFIRYLAILFLVLTVASCGEEKMPLSIQFHLEYADEPLVMLQDYTYPDGRTIRFTRVSFYISDLLVHGGGESEMIKSIDHINFTNSHQNLSGAQQGLQYYDGDISLESIDELAFTIGLSDEVNSTVPAGYPSGHVLANSGEYWIGWSSYIFAKIEGWVDLDSDGEVETSMALHLGSNAVRQEIKLEVPAGSGNLDVHIDVREIFDRGQIYDIVHDPQIHSLSQLDAALELAENLSYSFTLK